MKKIEWTLSEFEELTGVKRKIIERMRGDNGPLTDKKSWLKKIYNQDNIKIITEKQLFKIAIYLFVMQLSKNKKNDQPRSLRNLVSEFEEYLENDELIIAKLLSTELNEYQDILKQIVKAHQNNNTTMLIKIIKSIKKNSIEQISEVEDLKEEIDSLRKKLEFMAKENNNNLLSKQVQKLSQALDKKIIEYYSK